MVYEFLVGKGLIRNMCEEIYLSVRSQRISSGNLELRLHIDGARQCIGTMSGDL